MSALESDIDETGDDDAGLPASPAERVFRSHLKRATYLAAFAQGRWRLVSLDWPWAIFAVSAAPRTNSPCEFCFRIELTGYPGQAPQGYIWDVANNQELPARQRPKGERCALAFRENWDGLYLPINRKALAGHDWRTYRWNESRDIYFYLSLVHDLLNDDDYLGV